MNTAPLSSTPPGGSSRYSSLAIALHWLLAAGLLGMIAFGWYMTSLPFSPAKLKYFNWHKWAGVVILLLSVLRLLWRITHRPPPLPAHVAASMPKWQHLAHHGTHFVLYALFFVVPLAGLAYSSAAGFPVVWFGVLPLPSLVAPNQELAQVLKTVHVCGAWTLLAVIVLHVAAAFKHQYIDRDGLLLRMMPRRK